MSAEPTLAAQLREMIVPPACVELIEQASVRLDDLERQLATVTQAERERIKEMVCETCRQKL
jgi:hypothetical protein